MKKINKKYAGFSLVEVMFSIVVLATGILATVALVSSSITVSMDARNQMIAGELAQEGVELVRNIRDNNWQASPFVSSFNNISEQPFGYDYRIDMNNPINYNADYRLYINGDFYTHTYSVNTTKFKRGIIIIGNLTTRKVASVVTWDNSNPPDAANYLTNCTAVNKCAYTEVTLTEWGK